MAVLVILFFKIINIKDEHGERFIIAIRPSHQLAQAVFKGASIADTGQRIRNGQVFQVFIALTELLGGFIDLLLQRGVQRYQLAMADQQKGEDQEHHQATHDPEDLPRIPEMLFLAKPFPVNGIVLVGFKKRLQ